MKARRAVTLALTAATIALSSWMADTARAQLAPYTLADHRARQEVRLEIERTQLDFSAVFYPTGGEWTARSQAIALLCELEARTRESAPPHTLAAGEDDHFRAILESLLATFDPQNPPIGNVHSRRDGAMIAAYLLHRFRNHGWSQATLDKAFQLFKWAAWRKQGLLQGALSNNELNQTAMRLLAAEVFNDADLLQRARWEYRMAMDDFVRRGIAEATAPHYAGRVLVQLVLAWHASDSEIHGWLDALIAAHLASAAQVYLPGGGIGPPHQRDKDGALRDPNPAKTGTHLIQQLNMLVFDAALEAALPQPGQTGFADTYHAGMLATDYQVPELIRSMFLDKGAGYTFRGLFSFPWLTNNGLDPANLDVQLRGFPSTGWQGWNPSDPRSDPAGLTDLLVSPIESAMLPSGQATLGVHYGSGGAKAPSWSGYIRNPDAPSGFSILYHFQPRHGGDEPDEPWDPLVDDETWASERKTPYVRLMHHRTLLALYDTSIPAGPHPPHPHDDHLDPHLAYAIAHVPDFMDPCPGGDWWAGERDGAFMAYRPVGTLDGAPVDYPENGDAEAYTYLKLQGPISGFIAEIADHPVDVAAYCQDLEGRFYYANLSSAANATLKLGDVPNAAGGTDGLKLELSPETRAIGGVASPPIPDEVYFDHGMFDSVEAGGAQWLAWNPASFELTIARDLDAVYGLGPDPFPEQIVHDFGDPAAPTAPWNVEGNDRPNLTEDVILTWQDGWDDVGIIAYDVYRNGTLLASPATPGYTDADLCTQAPTLDIARYHLRGRDHVPAGPIDEAPASTPTHFLGTAILGDITPPTTPTNLKTQYVGNPILWWNASTDNWGIYAYWIVRTEVGSGEVTTAGTANTYWWDPNAESGKSYDYQVQAIDLCPRWSKPTDPVRVDVP